MTDGSLTSDGARRDERLLALSSLMDGAAAPSEAAHACAAWRDASEARAAWHAYHVIGDVLRSDELGLHARANASFVQTLRERLAGEPVPLAPQPGELAEPAPDHRARRRGWAAPLAVAAGFVAVAGVLVVTRVSTPAPVAAPQFALAPPAASTAAPVAVVDSLAEPQTLVANGQLIHDVRLDQYLAAHKQFSGSSALGVPSGFLRGATYDASGR